MGNQAAVMILLLACVLLGVGTIALIAYLNSKNNPEGSPEPELSTMEALERAIQVRREHAFLQRYPEWNGKDFRSDPSSPWHTDPEVGRPQNDRQAAMR